MPGRPITAEEKVAAVAALQGQLAAVVAGHPPDIGIEALGSTLALFVAFVSKSQEDAAKLIATLSFTMTGTMAIQWDRVVTARAAAMPTPAGHG